MKGISIRQALLLGLALLPACGSDGDDQAPPPAAQQGEETAIAGSVGAALLATIADDDEIQALLAANDQAGLPELLGSAAACEGVRHIVADLPHVPLYAREAGGVCAPAALEAAAQPAYFTDPACTDAIDYRPPDFAEFCASALVPAPNALLGNAAAWTEEAEPDPMLAGADALPWTLPVGPRLPVGIESLSGNSAPFMKRVRYRTIETPAGTCSLEMRVYKKDIRASGLRPLLAIHGGGWRLRSGAFLGLEAQLSHFTEQGFIVFAPFYRLAGERDGPDACNGVTWQEITADVSAALDWVQTFGPALGAAAGPVNVIGQSAGGFLAAWLATHRPADVGRGLLLYPPTDALDFIVNAARPGGEYPGYDTGVDLLATYLGIPDLSAIDTANPPPAVRENSLPALVTPATPPLFIIHGSADTVVPSNQSVLLCNAYGGEAVDDGGDPAASVFVRTYPCGAGELHLVAQGQHALDLVCLPGLNCPAGSLESAGAVADAFARGRSWLREAP